jgi:hypothetical protein
MSTARFSADTLKSPIQPAVDWVCPGRCLAAEWLKNKKGFFKVEEFFKEIL